MSDRKPHINAELIIPFKFRNYIFRCYNKCFGGREEEGGMMVVGVHEKKENKRENVGIRTNIMKVIMNYVFVLTSICYSIEDTLIQ